MWMIEERKGYLAENGRVKRGTEEVRGWSWWEWEVITGWKQSMSVKGLGDGELYASVCALFVCVSFDGAHLYLNSVTCRVFNKVSMLGVSFAPRWHRISLHELSRTWPTKAKCALRVAARPMCTAYIVRVCLSLWVMIQYCVFSVCAAQIFDQDEQEREEIMWIFFVLICSFRSSSLFMWPKI